MDAMQRRQEEPTWIHQCWETKTGGQSCMQSEAQPAHGDFPVFEDWGSSCKNARKEPLMPLFSLNCRGACNVPPNSHAREIQAKKLVLVCLHLRSVMSEVSQTVCPPAFLLSMSCKTQSFLAEGVVHVQYCGLCRPCCSELQAASPSAGELRQTTEIDLSLTMHVV